MKRNHSRHKDEEKESCGPPHRGFVVQRAACHRHLPRIREGAPLDISYEGWQAYSGSTLQLSVYGKMTGACKEALAHGKTGVN